MAYVPKSSADILRDLVAATVARSELTDISEGSVLSQILATVASELAGSEYRMALIRDSYLLSRVSGSDLDERCSELPPGGVVRLGETAASGPCMTLKRGSANPTPEELAEVLIVPRGATVGRVDEPSVLYALAEEVTFEIGEHTKNDVVVTCLIRGTVGNCPNGSINKMISLPTEITSISQARSIGGGQSAETDDSLRSRAFQYIGSLARCMPSAIEYAVRSFIASDGTRVKYAALYEDRGRRGYSEIVVDDGSVLLEGQIAVVRDGRTVGGVAPVGGDRLVIFHESPATSPIKEIRRFVGGVEQDAITPADFVSIPERGVVYVDPGIFDPGDRWEITGANGGDPDTGYQIFGGTLIPEIQRMIEGDLSNPAQNPGLRAAGTRVRVVPPSVENITDMDIFVTPVNGVSFVDTADSVKEAVSEFVLNLHPGETLFIAQLIDRVMDNPDVLNVRFFRKPAPGEEIGREPYPDRSPSSDRSVLRPDPFELRIIPPAEL